MKNGRLGFGFPGRPRHPVPTIADELPLTERAEHEARLTLIAEDWRQLEFFYMDVASQLDTDLEMIRRIRAERRDGDIGFDRVHVRRLDALVGSAHVSVASLAEATSVPVHSLAIGSPRERVPDGFVVEHQGVMLYGVVLADGTISILGIAEPGPASGEMPPPHVRTLMRRHQLGLVDWVNALVYAAPTP